MRNACLIAVAAIAAALATPVCAGEWLPAIPPEIGVAPRVGPAWATYRCSLGPVYNFYHGAYYGEEPPALYRGYAYRPYYRYTAFRRWPRTYFCVEEE